MTALPTFTDAQAHFRRMLGELARHGVTPDPRLELRAVPGLVSFYDLRNGHVYVGVHEPERPESRLMAHYLCDLLGLGENRLLELFRRLQPWAVGHELAHHLRHRAGGFSSDRQHEETVAHELAFAFFAYSPTPETVRLRALLAQALAAERRPTTAGPGAVLCEHLSWVASALATRRPLTVAAWVRRNLRCTHDSAAGMSRYRVAGDGDATGNCTAVELHGAAEPH